MFREIRTSEKIERNLKDREKEYGYLKIKPKKELSDEELNLFWNEVFNSIQNS